MRCAWALVDPAAATARLLEGPADARDWGSLIAIEADGAMVVIEDGRRVVRYGPGRHQTEVIFPR